MALTSGLRAGELRSLDVSHLDTVAGGLQLEASWTKNRKPGFQYLSRELVVRLAAFAEGGGARELYKRYLHRLDTTLEIPDNPLLYVPTHPARELYKDLKAAGIPKWTPEGKVDFHASRTAYATFAADCGATVKEAQTLLRHSNPNLTMNVYARARDNRLAHVAQKVGEHALPKREKRALCVHQRATGTDCQTGNGLQAKDLQAVPDGGGGGNRRWQQMSCPNPLL